MIFIDDHLKKVTDILSKENKKVFITGDFNFDLLNISKHNETFSFFDTMMSNFLLPLITIPIKINSGTNTLIDNIFTNHLHPDMKTGNLSIKIVFIRDCTYSKSKSPTKKTQFIFTQIQKL